MVDKLIKLSRNEKYDKHNNNNVNKGLVLKKN